MTTNTQTILPRLTDKEWLEVFPEAKEVITDKIKEWEERQEQVKEVIRKKLKIIQEKSKPENQWFWREVVKVWDGPQLIEINKQIAKLRALHSMSQGHPQPKGGVTEEQIEWAQQAPIESIAESQIQLTRRGNRLVGLCPFHKEKTPSFMVYIETNSFYCFGCQEGGNIINLTMSLYGLGFVEAVRWLSK